MHWPSGVLHILSCKLGASLECTAFAIKCTTEAIMYIRSLTWCTVFANRCTAYAIKCTTCPIMYFRSLTFVYCICHEVYCRRHHLTSGATLGCTTLAIKCNLMYFRGLTWVYCICHQVYYRSHHVYQEPHLRVLHLPSSVLQKPSCISGASLGCTAFAIKCIAYLSCTSGDSGASFGVLYLPRGVLHMPSSVLHVPSCTSGASLLCPAFANRCTAYAIMYLKSLTSVYCIVIKCTVYVHPEAHLGVLYLPTGVILTSLILMKQPLNLSDCGCPKGLCEQTQPTTNEYEGPKDCKIAQRTEKLWSLKTRSLLAQVNYSEKCTFEGLKGQSLNTVSL